MTYEDIVWIAVGISVWTMMAVAIWGFIAGAERQERILRRQREAAELAKKEEHVGHARRRSA